MILILKRIKQIVELVIISILFMILAITFMNTSALKDTKSLCLCIALLDNTFRRLADVNVEEKWSIEEMRNTSFKAIGKTDL